MAVPVTNPAILAFIKAMGEKSQIGQVLIEAGQTGFELRHHQDGSLPQSDLITCTELELRDYIALDDLGEFRPLKSAPDLRRGWRSVSSSPNQLWEQLNILYPGAVGDWYRQMNQPSSHGSYRAFVGRQSGMYRGASRLKQEEAATLTEACCSAKHCLKDRVWSIEPDDAAHPAESFLICREPCQLLLELARRLSKTKQEETIQFELPKSEAEALLKVLEDSSPRSSSASGQRIADFSSPSNPRRVDLLRQTLHSQFTRQKKVLGE